MIIIGSNILTIVLFIFILVFFFCTIQYLDMTAAASEADYVLKYGLKSAARQIDKEYLQETGEQRIDVRDARDEFEEKLKQNMNLNDDFTCSSNSKFQGSVGIVEFQVRNTPYTEPYWGTEFNSPGIHAVIGVTVRELFYGDGLTINLHYDTELDR